MPAGRPWKEDRDSLLDRVGEMRRRGVTIKVIAATAGYSDGRIQAICREFRLRKQFKLKRVIDLGAQST